MSHDDIVTHDFSKFGKVEIEEACQLLQAYLNKNRTKYLASQNITIEFNTQSGYVFLSDNDCNTAMLNEKHELVDFLVCPECGQEGLIDDLSLFETKHDSHRCKACQKYVWGTEEDFTEEEEESEQYE
jgi:uncharacterized protein YbaR (Trm112 family)